MSASAVADARRAQVEASEPRASVFVSANAGAGKTSTLVTRVARLLLAGAPPETILCVTFTKAGAAEMQRRLFARLGRWAVMEDADLERSLSEIGETGRDLRAARALFAQALETPGGLKIQTIHAFCEKLLRRFPLEAGVSPSFTVMEDAEAAEVSRRARDDVAELVLANPASAAATAYDHFSVQLDYRAFNAMFDGFAARRADLAAYSAACEGAGCTVEADIWKRCDFKRPTSLAAVEAPALARARGARWRRVAAALTASGKLTDRRRGEAMAAVSEGGAFADLKALFIDPKGEPRTRLATSAMAPEVHAWLAEEQARCVRDAADVCGAAIAEDTVRALVLATAYASLYEGAKEARGGLDFADLIDRANDLLTRRADVAWVLYKLDSGLRHVLLDEAQDTAPGQWDILRALTGEFFHGHGAAAGHRTMFAVGDEKQSIFSFQGAAPERLAHETDAFAALARQARETFYRRPLLESWRSAPQILELVDAVFADPQSRAGLRFGGDNVLATPPLHRAIRADDGCVDLWPLQGGEEAGGEVDYWAPVDSEPARSANRLLAGRVAGAVKDMVEAGEAVVDRESGEPRPCRWGDVMILVRRRRALFHEIIRALKRAGAPVAGADRLKLSEHGVFHDLMALGRFALLPSDDLALAGVLRGPLCDVGEESLFDLAHDRGVRLWTALRARAPERPEWEAAVRLLAWVKETAPDVAPFDFYCRLLGRIDADGRSMRQRILTRMSAEGEQALDAFVAQVLAAGAAGARDLESALDWLAGLDLEIKREQDEASGDGEVRVMTVHGAKGLEAPIVILPDTTTRAQSQGGPLLETGEGAFLWAPRKGDDCAASRLAREARDKAAEDESARLLYVALTRPRDRLIVCGVELHKSQQWRFERSWYDYVRRAFEALETHRFALPGGGEGDRFGRDPRRGGAAAAGAPGPAALPDWLVGLAPAELSSRAAASPSKLGEDVEGAAPSPLAEVGGLGRYRRGDLIHRLLQLLPDLAPGGRAAGAAGLLAREPGLTQGQRAEMAAAALGVLEDDRFAAVFGPGSRAEVALVGGASALPPDLTVSGRVDRLVVDAERVLVVDFKTNRPAPTRIEDVAQGYIVQMAVYRALLRDLYPGRRVEAALVWTDGPQLMSVPAQLMDGALAALAEAGGSRPLTARPQNLEEPGG